MSILIKGIDLPEAYGPATLALYECADGRGSRKTFDVSAAQMQALPPGKLIDANELKEWIEAWFTMHRGYHPYSRSNLIPATEIIDIIDRLPTILEAEIGIHYGDICDNCTNKDNCDMAKSSKHQPPITACYGYKEEGKKHV